MPLAEQAAELCRAELPYARPPMLLQVAELPWKEPLFGSITLPSLPSLPMADLPPVSEVVAPVVAPVANAVAANPSAASLLAAGAGIAGAAALLITQFEVRLLKVMPCGPCSSHQLSYRATVCPGAQHALRGSCSPTSPAARPA
jgi:hypothetical protein